MPPGYGALLVSDESLAAVPVTASTRVTLPAGQTQHFRLVIGNAAALDAARSGHDRIPSEVRLASPYPSPFATSTTIAAALPRTLDARVAVYDVSGRLVRTLLQGQHTAGVVRADWDGRDKAGTRVAAGIYFVKLTAGAVEQTQKVVLVR